MRIAIETHSADFGERWIRYCEANGLSYVPVNLADADAVGLASSCDVLLARPNLDDEYSEYIKAVLRALEHAGLVVYPNEQTVWHYENKIAQVALLKAIGAPVPMTRVHYNEEEAFASLDELEMPLVFKLKVGASSSNVRLVRNRRYGRRLVRTMFGRGMISSPSYFGDVRRKARSVRNLKDLLDKAIRFPSRFQRSVRRRRNSDYERGYVYLQEFLPGNDCDTRVTTIGNRVFAFRRFVRPNDFRASGSGNISYNTLEIDRRCLEIAARISKQMGFQSMAYDFLFDARREPVIVEMSYNFAANAIYACEGYWDEMLNFHQGHCWPQDCIIEDALARKV